MGRTLVDAPAVEPVTKTEAKAQLRITHSDEDTIIDGLITAARHYSENYCQRVFITQTWDLFLDCFPAEIEIPFPPLQSVTHIKYIDTDGNEQTLSASNYTVDSSSFIGRIVPAYGESWPSIRYVPNAVNVRFVAGYGDAASDVPETIKLAMKMLIAHWYENRETVKVGTITKAIEFSYEALLDPYRVITF
jgi:uncharacterized phiE125 gp8 family phage protein